MSPLESSMPLIAFLLFTHARLQDNVCAMSHDSYVGSNLLWGEPNEYYHMMIVDATPV